MSGVPEGFVLWLLLILFYIDHVSICGDTANTGLQSMFGTEILILAQSVTFLPQTSLMTGTPSLSFQKCTDMTSWPKVLQVPWPSCALLL